MKLKVSEIEDKVQTVRDFCKTYRISREREEIIRNEVIKYFDARKAEKIALQAQDVAAMQREVSPRKHNRSVSSMHRPANGQPPFVLY